MEIIDYKKRCSSSNEPTGSIAINVYNGKTTYIAVTLSTSKTYKSLKKAEAMMEFFDYVKINN